VPEGEAKKKDEAKTKLVYEDTELSPVCKALNIVQDPYTADTNIYIALL